MSEFSDEIKEREEELDKMSPEELETMIINGSKEIQKYVDQLKDKLEENNILMNDFVLDYDVDNERLMELKERYRNGDTSVSDEMDELVAHIDKHDEEQKPLFDMIELYNRKIGNFLTKFLTQRDEEQKIDEKINELK